MAPLRLTPVPSKTHRFSSLASTSAPANSFSSTRRRLLPGNFFTSLVFGLGIFVGLLLTAQAGPKNAAPLQTWPSAKVRSLAPLLRSTDITVIESEPSGQMRQISIFTLVMAPPGVCRDSLLRAERYPDFVRNFKVSKVAPPRPDGSFDHYYVLSYGMFSVDGGNRYLPLPADGEGDAAPVEMIDTDEGTGGTRHYRWEFYSAAGATVMAMYGYTNVRNSEGLIAKLFARVPQLEHGMALVSQLALSLSVKQRSEQIQGAPPLLPAQASAPYDFLLERGVVVLLRNQNGRLSEQSMIDRSPAAPNQLVEVIKQVGSWSQFIPTIIKSAEAGGHDDVAQFQIEQALPLLTFRTTYGVRTMPSPAGGSVDMLGVEGDLKGSRMRWDVTPGRGMASQVVLRSSQQFDRGSIAIRQLYKLEPLLEYGVNVGLQLVLLRAVKGKAEQPKPPGN